MILITYRRNYKQIIKYNTILHTFYIDGGQLFLTEEILE